MHTTITTTVTTTIDLETFTPDHKVLIDCEDDLPESVIYAAVLGGLRATRNSVLEKSGLDDGDGDDE